MKIILFILKAILFIFSLTLGSIMLVFAICGYVSMAGFEAKFGKDGWMRMYYDCIERGIKSMSSK